MHPYGVAREPCPPTYTLHGEIAAVRVEIFGVVYVASSTVEPVLGSTACLNGIAINACFHEVFIAQGGTQHPYTAPALHGLGTGLLSVAIALVAHTTCEGVSQIGVEGAEAGEGDR